MVSKGDFWLENFEIFIREKLTTSAPNTQKDFLRSLIRFLEREEYTKYRSDIRLNSTGHIVAIKIIMRIRGLGAHNDEPRAEFLRQQLRKSAFEGFIYDTRYIILFNFFLLYYPVFVFNRIFNRLI